MQRSKTGHPEKNRPRRERETEVERKTGRGGGERGEILLKDLLLPANVF